MEIMVANNPEQSRFTKEQVHEELQRDFEEIRRLGMVDRAKNDCRKRFPTAKLEHLWVGYFNGTNVIWCRLAYRLDAKTASHREEFGYSLVGTNWNLKWDDNEN